MKIIETEILIKSTPEQVWAVLTDFESFPDWNPFIRSIKGQKKVGETLEVQIQPPGGKGMTFRPEVLKFDAGREFRWRGKLLFPGVFDGEHYFILEEKSGNQTLLTHGELFSGFLVGLLGGLLSKTADGFRSMNEAIKTRCEQIV